MDEEAGFLSHIGENPTDVVAKLAYADWLAERSRPEETAWRWIAAFKRIPCPFRVWRMDGEPYWDATATNVEPADHAHGGYGWRSWTMDAPWPWAAGFSLIPSPLFRFLPNPTVVPSSACWSEKNYYDCKQAFQVLVTAFMDATRPRTNWFSRKWRGEQWVPDWSLVDQVPQE